MNRAIDIDEILKHLNLLSSTVSKRKEHQKTRKRIREQLLKLKGVQI